MNNTLLKSYLRCKRKAWLDFKGNKYHQKWSAQKSIQLITEYKNFKNYTNGNIYTGLKGCEQGYKGVLGIKINNHGQNDLSIQVNPSILIKDSGNSIWGNYKYIPAVSKLGRRTNKTHLYDLALSSILLEDFQNSRVEHGLVISTHKNILKTEKINLSKNLKQNAINIFSELSISLKKGIPLITEDRKKCSICTWQQFCDNEAKSNGNLTDIDGIGTKTAKFLYSIDINNIQELAKYDNKELSDKLSIMQFTNSQLIPKLISQSKSYLSGKPIRINKKNKLFNIFKKGNLGFFIFDIESNPEQNHDFLYGFLSVNNINKKVEDSSYTPILNLLDSKNKNYISEIFLTINSHKHWPILHYGDTEKIAIIKLAKKINLDNYEIAKLKDRFIDLHLIIRNNWILPLKNYSLKTVANWIGFNWGQKNVSGSKALYWWLQYLDTKNNSFLKKIIAYNQDDCLATLQISKWLITKEND